VEFCTEIDLEHTFEHYMKHYCMSTIMDLTVVPNFKVHVSNLT